MTRPLVAAATVALLSACGSLGAARRVPGGDVALRQRTELVRSLLTMSCDADGIALVRPDSSTVGCAIARRDTSKHDRGGVGLGPRPTP